jgi:hypothetical protein
MIVELRERGAHLKNIAAEPGVHPKTVSRALLYAPAVDPLAGRQRAERSGDSSVHPGRGYPASNRISGGLHPAEASTSPIAT